MPRPRAELSEYHEKRSAYALIIGVYNEGARFTKQLDAMQPYRKFVDVIIADGGSTDGATSCFALTRKVRSLLVNTDEQRGLSVQYRIALRYALGQGYAGVVMMDGNGKDGPEAIPRFIQALQQGHDFVQGSRFMPGGRHLNTPVDRVIGIRFVFNPLMRIGSGFRYTDGMNGFKACSVRFLADPAVSPFRDVFVGYGLQYYFNYIAPKLGFRVVEIPVTRVYARDGHPNSKIRGVRSRIRLLLEMFFVITGRCDPRPAAEILSAKDVEFS